MWEIIQQSGQLKLSATACNEFAYENRPDVTSWQNKMKINDCIADKSGKKNETRK